MRKRGWLAAAGAAGLAAGLAAERVAVRRRRRSAAEQSEDLGKRRGDRSKKLLLPDGAQLFVEEKGPKSKRGVVFVHGSALRTDLWHYQMNSFPGRRLIFYDLRGHGLSQPKGTEDPAMKLHARDLKAVVDDAGLEEVVLVGHSIGGMICLESALEFPDLLGDVIKGLVLTNTTAHPPVETIFGGAAVARFERLTRRPFEMLGPHSNRIDYLRRIIKPSDAMFWTIALSAFGHDPSAKQIDFTYDMLAETPSDVIFDLFKAYRSFDAKERLHEVTVPCLVVTGTEDRLTLSAASKHLADNLPKAELLSFDGCGHMTMMERHEEYNHALEAFLVDTLGRARNR